MSINGIAWDIVGVNGIKMACNGLTKGFAVAENQVFSDGYGAAFMGQVCSSYRARLWLPGGRLKADRVVIVAARRTPDGL